MKKIDPSDVIVRYVDHDKVIHDVSLISLLEGGVPINDNDGSEMEYLGTYLLPAVRVIK